MFSKVIKSQFKVIFLLFLFFAVLFLQIKLAIAAPNLGLFNKVKKPSITVLATVKPLNQAKHMYTLSLLVTIPDRFHLYSFEKQGEFAPHPSSLTINKPWQVYQKIQVPKAQLLFDAAFQKKLAGYQHEFKITQQIQYTKKNKPPTYVSGYLSYQICDNVTCFDLQKASFYTSLN